MAAARDGLQAAGTGAPPQLEVTQLTMGNGNRPCAPETEPAWVSSLGQARASNVTDPDGDQVAVEFRAYWDAGDGQENIVRWESGLSTARTSGSVISMPLPTGIPRQVPVQWEARVYAGGEFSPWSSEGAGYRCTFIYDTSVPATPVVTSPEYPEINAADPLDPWRNGAGRYGHFTFDGAENDVVTYAYTLSGSEQRVIDTVSTSEGAPRTVALLPERAGGYILEVRAIDRAGNSSPRRSYTFRVSSGTPALSVWELDEAAGADEAESERAAWPATLRGSTTLGAGGVSGSALRLDGVNGYARSSATVVDTSKSFTVSLWARLPEAGVSATGTAASAAGNRTDAFRLSVDPDTGGWSFGVSGSDTAGAEVTRARQDSAAALGQWSHITGVFDAASGEVLLYVDGERAGSAVFGGTPGEGRAGIGLGARVAGTGADQFFSGDLDEVQFFDYALTGAQVAALTDRQSITEGGRPATALWSFEEAIGATSVAGQPQAADAQVSDGVTFGIEGMRGTSATFDGTGGVAATTQPVIDTDRTFAIAAWARLSEDKPEETMVVAAQGVGDNPGFALVHAPDGRGWTLRHWSEDGAGGTLVEVSESPCDATEPDCAAAHIGAWTHVAGVYDHVREELRLFVNGELAGSAPFSAPADAGGRFIIGAAQDSNGGFTGHFDGQIDDVRVWDRMPSPEELRLLARETAQVAGRWKFETAENGTTPDESSADRPLTLGGDPVFGPGWFDMNALSLDGVDDHATLNQVPVDTSESFSVGVWAQAATVPTAPATLVSAPAADGSAFAVRFVPDPDYEGWGTWEVVLSESDGSAVTIAHNGFFDVREWNHIVLVYDAVRQQARLHVNGQLQESGCDASGESCERVSWVDHVTTDRATESLEVGRARVNGSWGEYWPGSVDDLWLIDGPLSRDQVAWLSGSHSGTPSELPNF
jgi:hypothetical protein